MHTLITGVNGFLGSEVIRQAVDAGMVVRGTDQNDTSCFSGIDYYRGDILYPNSLKPLAKGMECLIHIAGLAHIFGRKQAGTAPFKAVNETGTANVARVAAEAGVKHFLLISSVSVYGPSASEAYDETAPCSPVEPYAESKYQAEQRAIEIAEATGMSLTILRLATLYGKGDPGNVARLIKAIDKGCFFWIGDGSNRKSLLHKEDAARAILKATRTNKNGIAIYNVSAPPCTMREIVEGLSRGLGRHIPKWHIPPSLALGLAYMGKTLSGGHSKLGGLHTTLKKWLADDIYDPSKFEKAFNFKTQVELAEGLRREVTWYLRIKNIQTETLINREVRRPMD